MAIYKKLTNTDAQDLIVKGNTSNRFGGRVGGVSKIILTNVHGSVEPTVTVFLDDGTTQYTLCKTVIPTGVTLVLTDNISELLTDNFVNNIFDDPDLKIIVDAFQENSLNQWIPKNKMIMYHGTADITVPYQNSLDTYNDFISLGANKDIIEFIDLEGENHSSGSLPYIVDLFDKFEQLK